MLPLVLGVSATHTPSWADTCPLRRTSPWAHTPLSSACWDTHTPCPVHAGIQSTSRQYASHWNAFLILPANKDWGKVIFSEACVKNSVQGGAIPACIAGDIPACLAGFQAHTQGGSLGGSGQGVSRPTPKGEVEGVLARGVTRPTPKGGVEGDLAGGSSGPHLGVCSQGDAWT